MNHATAPTSLGIKIVTGAVIGLAGVFLVLSYKFPALLLGLVILVLLIFGCYLRAPVAYDTAQGALTVLFRAGSKGFGRVLDCETVRGKLPMTLRVWGNGGVFAGTGIYWNRQWRMFRAYVTTSDASKLVLVQTTSHKVLVSPADPVQFIAAVTAGE